MKIEKGDLIVPISNLLSSMTGEGRRSLIQALACEDSILAEVSSQIITGWTSDSWSAGRPCSWSIEPWCALDVAIRRVAEASGDVAKNEIERANREIESLKEKLKKAETRWDRLLSRLESLQFDVRTSLERDRSFDEIYLTLEAALRKSHVRLDGEM